MTRRSSATQGLTTDAEIGIDVATSRVPHQSEAPDRSGRLVEMIDHLDAAKRTSDALGEKFLSYLLSMAIQETRVAMRGVATVAGP